MVTLSRADVPRPASARAPDEPDRESEDSSEELMASAKWLRQIVERVTEEEFRWQEAHYDHDSRQGRELLFLIANHEWVRATSELVDIVRSDAVETEIKIDIDLDQITHEAFRGRTGRFWLPVTVLPPLNAPAARLEPDPFATVTDAAGHLLPMLPVADLYHQMSAAMAEIIVNMAVARWPGPDSLRPTATRSQRMLLSAAIYRLLRHGPAGPQAAGPEPVGTASPPRMARARESLLTVLDSYNQLLREPARNSPPESRTFAPELTRRAVKVLLALAGSVVVVVPIDREAAPTVVTVHVPTRSLHTAVEWRLMRPSEWALRPLGRLEIDLLMPTADADREVQIHLPDGVSFDEECAATGSSAALPRIDIMVNGTQPLQELATLLRQICRPRDPAWPSALLQCLTDLARSKADAVHETLQHYEVNPGAPGQPDSVANRAIATSQAHRALEELRDQLGQITPGDPLGSDRLSAAAKSFESATAKLFRRTSAYRPSPRVVVTRADLIEEVAQRAVPVSAKVYADVAVTDGEYFSIARVSGRMSLLLMTVVLCFLVAARLLADSPAPSPEVLAIVLTLFSAIQAGQMERRDRSTLHGQLSAAGNWLIATSILPAVILAIALAFPRGGWVPTFWATACVGLQLLLQLAMWRGPLAPTGSAGAAQRRVLRTAQPVYKHFEALRSDYWRSTTADALMIGRAAYAYVTWQHEPGLELSPLLTGSDGATGDYEPANVVALLRAGTLSQAVTFVVFREEPADGWAGTAEVAARLDLDPDRLAPMESVENVVDIFVGVHREELLPISAHPVTAMLEAAAHRLIVLEAQLPVPAPVADGDAWRWGRVRVALRDNEDMEILGPFLSAVYRGSPGPSRGAGRLLAIRTVPMVTPRIIATGRADPPRPGPVKRLVRTDDLDVVNSAATAGESPEVRTWRLLTTCVDARSGIENDILQRLAGIRPHWQLAGLTYALLHGTAVVVLLIHDPDGHGHPEHGLEQELRGRPGMGKLRLAVNQALSREDLGPPERYPLLRVHFRWRDRPGAMLSVLNSLSEALGDRLPAVRSGGCSVSYARTQVAAGRAALARMTIRLHVDAGPLESWDPGTSEEIERKIRTLAVEAAGQRPGMSSAAGTDSSEVPVISVDTIVTAGNGRAGLET